MYFATILSFFSFIIYVHSQCNGLVMEVQPNAGYFSHLNYLSNENCYWRISFPQTSGKILLSTPFFNTEMGYDILQIYNNGTNEIIEDLSGATTFSTFVSLPTTLFFTFTSDNSIQEDGFRIAFQYFNTSDSFSNCTREVLTSPSGFFGRAPSYNMNEDCSWLIVPPPGYFYIQIEFPLFDTELQYDTVRIYDGNSTSAITLGVFSGLISNLNPISTSQPTAFVVFRSDITESRKGFIARYQAIQNPPITSGSLTSGIGSTTGIDMLLPCMNTVLNTTQGSFGRNGYFDQDYCAWFVVPPPGYQKILFNFTFFSTQLNADFVTIYDGPSVGSNIIGRFSGNPSTPFYIASSQANAVVIVFESDSGITSLGFRVSYSCVNESEIVSGSFSGSPEIESTTKNAVLSGAVIAITGIIGGVLFAGVLVLGAVLIVRRQKKTIEKAPIPLQLVDY